MVERRRQQQPHLPAGRRGVLHKVRVTDEQEAQLVAKAEAHGWTVARLLAESALSGSAEDAAATKHLLGELFDLQRSFAAVGNNLNQVARATNATRELQPQTFAVLDRLDVELARLRRFLDRLETAR